MIRSVLPFIFLLFVSCSVVKLSEVEQIDSIDNNFKHLIIHYELDGKLFLYEINLDNSTKYKHVFNSIYDRIEIDSAEAKPIEQFDTLKSKAHKKDIYLHKKIENGLSYISASNENISIQVSEIFPGIEDRTELLILDKKLKKENKVETPYQIFSLSRFGDSIYALSINCTLLKFSKKLFLFEKKNRISHGFCFDFQLITENEIAYAEARLEPIGERVTIFILKNGEKHKLISVKLRTIERENFRFVLY